MFIEPPLGFEQSGDHVRSIGTLPTASACRAPEAAVESDGAPSDNVPSASQLVESIPDFGVCEVSITDGSGGLFISEQEFDALVIECQRAIDQNHRPQCVRSDGTGESYLLKNDFGDIVAIFKLEVAGHPCGSLARILGCACCSGHSDYPHSPPKNGQVGEAVASIVDDFLGLHMVPRTRIVQLVSSAFGCTWKDRYQAWKVRRLAASKGIEISHSSVGYPPKVGSFQVKLEGFQTRSAVLAKLECLHSVDSSILGEYQRQFERMTILDYVLQNTHRTESNWLVGFSECRTATGAIITAGVKFACVENDGVISIRDHDPLNPLGQSLVWTTLPEASIPYSDEIERHLLPRLHDDTAIDRMIVRLQSLCSQYGTLRGDQLHQQMAALRGRLYCLGSALEEGDSPAKLLQRSPNPIYKNCPVASEISA